MVKQQSTAKGFTILGVSGVINKILAVLYVPILTLLIDDFGNGIYNAGYMMYLLIFVITNTGIPVAISKLVSEQVALENYRDSYRTLKISAIMLISLGAVTSILTAVFAPWFSNLLGWPEASKTILALSPTMFFTAVSCTFRGYFQGRSNMLPTGISQIIEQFVNSILTILFAWLMLRYGVHYAAAHGITDAGQVRLLSIEFAAAGGTVGTSAGAMVSAMFLCIVYYRNKRSIVKEVKKTSPEAVMAPTREIVSRILKYAIPITIGSVAIYTANLIDLKFTKSRLIVAGFSQVDASAMYGVLSTQYQKVIYIPLAISTALAAAIIPSISAAVARRDQAMLGRTINQSLKAILMASIPAAVGLAVLARPVIMLLFPRNVRGVDLMIMGSWVLIMMTVVSIQTAILQGIGKTYVPTIHLVLSLIFKILINYSLIAVKAVNIKGAIVGTGVCYCMACLLNHRSIKRYTQVKIKSRVILNRPLISSAFMAVVVLIIYSLSRVILGLLIKSPVILNGLCTCMAIGAGGFSYLIAMIAIRGITLEDIRRFPGGGKVGTLLCKIPFLRILLLDHPLLRQRTDG